MKMLMKVEMPIEPFNSLVREGTAGQTLGQILERIKPEAAYFTADNGRRGGILVVDVEDPSKIPFLAEPFFLKFDAEVKFIPYMTPEDLAKSGLEELGSQWG